MNARDTEILESSMGNLGSKAITGSTEITGAFTAFTFIEDSVVTSVTDKVGYANADLSDFTTIIAGTTVYGEWIAITLTSGSAIGYYGR